MRTAFALALAALTVALPAAGSTPNARILFQEGSGPGADLVALDADATSYRNLTPGTDTFYVSDEEGSWSPDGARIVFTSHRDSNVSEELYVMNADGSNQQRLTHDGPQGVQSAGTEVFDYAPAWSPAGDAIAYLKSVHSAVDVWLMRPDGSGQHALTSDGGMKTAPGWSPDGTRVTYELNGSTLVVSASGGRPVQLAAGVGLSWSPDGSRIAYVNGDGLWVAGSDGINPTRIVTMVAATPSWSRDGSRILFLGTRYFPELSTPKFGAPARQDIYTVRPDGGDLRRLTGPHGDEYATGPVPYWPSWWPDGSRVFFGSQPATGPPTTYVMNADGSCEGPFAQTATQLSHPLWRPGSRPGLGPIHCVDLRISLDLTAVYAPLGLRQTAHVRLNLDNDGSEPATGVRVQVSLSSGTAVIDENGGALDCTGTRNYLVCTLPQLSPGSSVPLAFGVTAGGPPSVGLRFSVEAVEHDSDTTNNTIGFGDLVLPCDQVGTDGADRLYGTPKRDRICARPGPDQVYGRGGNDYLDAGSGADVVVGGPGRDTILGGGGSDTIYARDGERDTIDCGTEKDIAIVDRRDVVRRCETVVRRG